MATFLNINSVKLNKWQVALILGTPLAIGLGMYVLNRSSRDGAKSGKTPGNSSDAGKTRQKGKIEKQNLSIDGTATDAELEQKKKSAELGEKMSPLKEANNYKTEGNNCYRNGKYDEAISFYDKAIDKCPTEHRTDMAIFYQNRAASYEMLKKWNKVKEDCTLSLEYNPRYAKAYYRRARAHEATRDMTECLDDVTATCILEMFQNNNTIMFADRVLKETGRIDAEKGLRDRVPVVPSSSFIDTYMRSFIADPLQTLVLPEPTENDAPPRGFIRARRAFDEQKYDEIIAACTEEIESSEAESQYKVEALLMRGTFHLLCGSFADSKLDFDAILANADADITLRTYAYIRRAALFIQTEEREKGLADFAEAEKLTPDNPDVYHQRAQILLLLEQIDAALVEFDKAVRLAPNHAIANVQKCYAEYRLALMSGDQKSLERVIKDFELAIKKFPDCVECYSLMAQVLADQQQFPQAQNFYDMAMKRAPTNPALLVHQAIMMLQWRGDIDAAVSLLNRAIEVDPKCELAYETLGTVEVQRAQLRRAVELFEKALLYAKSQAELVHVYSLRNAALAQINVTRKLGIDMNSVSAMAQSGFMQQGAM
ncbi:PREDICTED: mitochondrial import receptor subunit TOM70 isoform X1 [Drosophila arizonae]|uniref:Mitochondrial import receptor subunit TOM70 isoform X1 n=1 Tax=Drosophila arizonae TaxID=7263 RepID=A0ABM1NW64_DROAR|nr:PREDICTED: mitochondrial import receptor subunit TOM70 isoform X1 [Drosophila arizonae]